MPGKITRFRINGLHNLRTIDIPIIDNRLVLVGENGTGKSTVANFIYFFLTGQWHRMLDYEFNSVLAVLDAEEILITRDELKTLRKESSRRRPVPELSAPASLMRRIESFVAEHPAAELLSNRRLLVEQAEEIGLPAEILQDFIMQIESNASEVSPLEKRRSEILSNPGYRVLYLPTYRRIEQDLQAIFPGLDLENIENRRFRDRFVRRRTDARFVELVEFGMEDVERTIKSKMEEIKDEVRNGLNNLTGTYLRDVIRGDYRTSDLMAKLSNLDESLADSILNRIPKAILSTNEQDRLKAIIVKINQTNRIDDDDKVVAHFLTKLIDLYRIQQEKEKAVKDFVNVCNEYLSGKEISYDSIAYATPITQKSINGKTFPLTMKMLSSGEKQIVSLFSHIYLSSNKHHFVIIDEPELSLSVPWQKKFLPDILNTGRCGGILAVTHSPFVYDNELSEYTHSLEEFVEFTNVVS